MATKRNNDKLNPRRKRAIEQKRRGWWSKMNWNEPYLRKLEELGLL